MYTHRQWRRRKLSNLDSSAALGGSKFYLLASCSSSNFAAARSCSIPIVLKLKIRATLYKCFQTWIAGDAYGWLKKIFVTRDNVIRAQPKHKWKRESDWLLLERDQLGNWLSKSEPIREQVFNNGEIHMTARVSHVGGIQRACKHKRNYSAQENLRRNQWKAFGLKWSNPRDFISLTNTYSHISDHEFILCLPRTVKRPQQPKLCKFYLSPFANQYIWKVFNCTDCTLLSFRFVNKSANVFITTLEIFRCRAREVCNKCQISCKEYITMR